VARTSRGAVRFAMIGAGKHATNAIYPSLRHSRLDLVALADLDRERGESVAKRFGAKRVYTRHHDLLAREDVELVGVVGPPRMHVEVGLDVLASGRHLFIEKPPGETLEEARRLQDAARAAGKQLMVGFMKRFASAYQRAKLISTTDSFGSPSVLRLNYSHWQYEHLRSHLLYMSTHALDLARFFLGEVAGGTVYKRAMGVGMIVSLMLEHVKGGLSQLTLSCLEPRRQESIDLSGDNTVQPQGGARVRGSVRQQRNRARVQPAQQGLFLRSRFRVRGEIVRKLKVSSRRPFRSPTRTTACDTYVQSFARLSRRGVEHGPRQRQNSPVSLHEYGFSWSFL